MSKIEITINGIRIEVPKNTLLKDLMDKFFRARCEFIVKINSEIVDTKEQGDMVINNADELQIVAYSRHNYIPQKRTAYIEEKREKTL